MRQFLRNTILFSLPVAGWVIYLLASPVPKSYGYHMISKDCRSGDWIYNRLWHNSREVDIAVIGTSMSMCAVDDFLLEEELQKRGFSHPVSANFGVCRQGRDLHYAIAKDLLGQKSPKILILEVNGHEPHGSHEDFHLIASKGDLFSAPVMGNSSYLPNIQNAAFTRWTALRESILDINYSFAQPELRPDHSFMTVADDLVMPEEQRKKVESRRERKMASTLPTGFPKSLVYSWNTLYSRAYIEKISELAQKSGLRLLLLYLPKFGTPSPAPLEQEWFEQIGTLLLPPDSIIGNGKLYFDPDHLNQAGSRLLTKWLANEIQRIVPAPGETGGKTN